MHFHHACCFVGFSCVLSAQEVTCSIFEKKSLFTVCQELTGFAIVRVTVISTSCFSIQIFSAVSLPPRQC